MPVTAGKPLVRPLKKSRKTKLNSVAVIWQLRNFIINLKIRLTLKEMCAILLKHVKCTCVTTKQSIHSHLAVIKLASVHDSSPLGYILQSSILQKT